jgi:hypothetical protein
MARAYQWAKTFWGSVKVGLEVLTDSVRDLIGTDAGLS